MRPACYAVDFDFTIAHIGSYDGLFDIFLRRGVPDEIVKSAYAAARQKGFAVLERN